MSLPYYCTKCGRQHVRGAIYNEHLDFKRGADCPDHDEQMTFVNPAVPTCTTTFNLCPTFPSECGKHNNTTYPPIMEVKTPTKAEILASIDEACTEAAIPAGIIPTVASAKDGGTVDTWEPRMDFHKYNEHGLPDRVIEAVQHETLPAMRHGEPIKKRHWWQQWRRT